MDIDNAGKIQQLQKDAHYLEVINTFASQLLLAQTVDEIVWAVAKQAVGKLGYIDCIVYLYDEERDCLVQRAAHGPKNPVDLDIMNPITLQLGEGICGTVALSGKAELIRDTSGDDRYLIDDEIRYSEITVPIISGEKVLGVIDSEHPDKDFYTEQDLEILTTIASMTSAKLDQAVAREKLKASNDRLEIAVNKKTAELQKNISELKEANDQIQQSMKEKEVLLKEIHHRVKNNLQVISSLLNLHANRLSNSSDVSIFEDCRNQIMSMSAIHDQLYKKKDMARIEAQQYIVEICDTLLNSFNRENVTLEFEVQPISLDLDHSVPVGLILNELVVNALKHGFPENKAGVVRIEMKRDGKEINFRVADNGIGMMNGSGDSTMGFELIETLASQIDGTFEIKSIPGSTNCTVRFPYD